MKINTSFQKRNYGIIIPREYSKCTKSKVLRVLNLYENLALCQQPETEGKSEFLLLCCWLPTVISMETSDLQKQVKCLNIITTQWLELTMFQSS